MKIVYLMALLPAFCFGGICPSFKGVLAGAMEAAKNFRRNPVLSYHGFRTSLDPFVRLYREGSIDVLGTPLSSKDRGKRIAKKIIRFDTFMESLGKVPLLGKMSSLGYIPLGYHENLKLYSQISRKI